MDKIRCPHCGAWQEFFPHITLCRNCDGDLKKKIEKHSPETVSDKKIPVGSGLTVLESRKIQTYLREQAGSGHSRLLAILAKTGRDFVKRFVLLFPLFYLSIFFFTLIGLLISILGLPMAFPEYFAMDPSLAYLAGGGILICLFASLYTQLAFLLAVSDQHLSTGDVLAKAWSRIFSYITLMLVMAIIIGFGYSILMIPGIIASVLLIFAPVIFATENAGVTEALSKSVSFVTHDTLRVFLSLAPVPLMIIFTLFFFAYGGAVILWKLQNEFLFVCIISAVISIPLMLMTLYIYQVYFDLQKSQGLVPADDSAIPHSQHLEGEVPAPIFFSSQELSPFFQLLRQAWGIFQKRFYCLSVLNILSYVPHLLNFSFLIAMYLSLKSFIEAFGLKGQFGMLGFLVLPQSVYFTFVLGIIISGILYLFLAIFGLISYLRLELAFVYAIADDTLTPRQAREKSRNRLHGFFQANLYRKFIVSTGGLLLFPGYMFWVWYEFTPFVFAMQQEGQTPLSSLAESRELVRTLWGQVFNKMISFRMLPVAVISVLILIIIAGLPFQQMLVLFWSIFSGMPPVGIPSLNDPQIWLLIITGLYFYTLLIQIPLQKVFLYLLYRELKAAKTAETAPSHHPFQS